MDRLEHAVHHLGVGLEERLEIRPAEVEHAREIVRRGTSAHRQLAIYGDAMQQGATREEALKSVVDFLIEETVAGL